VAEVTVRYKRLETTGPFCNVEIEATATTDVTGGERYIGVTVARLRKELEAEVNQAVEDAKAQKRAEYQAEQERFREQCGTDCDDGYDEEDEE